MPRSRRLCSTPASDQCLSPSASANPGGPWRAPLGLSKADSQESLSSGMSCFGVTASSSPSSHPRVWVKIQVGSVCRKPGREAQGGFTPPGHSVPWPLPGQIISCGDFMRWSPHSECGEALASVMGPLGSDQGYGVTSGISALVGRDTEPPLYLEKVE